MSCALVQVSAASYGLTAIRRFAARHHAHHLRAVIGSVASKAPQRGVGEVAPAVPAAVTIFDREGHIIGIFAGFCFGDTVRQVCDFRSGRRGRTGRARTDVRLHDTAQAIVSKQQSRIASLAESRAPGVLHDPVTDRFRGYRCTLERYTGCHVWCRVCHAWQMVASGIRGHHCTLAIGPVCCTASRGVPRRFLWRGAHGVGAKGAALFEGGWWCLGRCPPFTTAASQKESGVAVCCEGFVTRLCRALLWW